MLHRVVEDTSTDTSETIYMSLAARLRQSIRDGAFRPGDMLGSEYELARQESISRMTVRRASDLLIKEGLVERRPGKGLFVRNGSPAPARLVQVVVGNLEWEPCRQIARGVQSAAREMGIQVQLYDAHGDAGLDVEVVRGLPDGPASGAVIVSLHGNLFNEVVYSLKTRGYPFVLVDQRMYDIDVPSVMANNYSGGYQVGQDLLAAGHRRMAFIGDLVANTVRDRLGGFRDAINDAGLPFDRSLTVDLVQPIDRLGDWSTRIEPAVVDLMKRHNRPTALFCSCDAIARSAYRAVQGLGLSVPNDLSIVGFDNDPLADWLQPGLTSVAQPFHEMGSAAMQILQSLITKSSTTSENRLLPVELVRRHSVAAPAKHV